MLIKYEYYSRVLGNSLYIYLLWMTSGCYSRYQFIHWFALGEADNVPVCVHLPYLCPGFCCFCCLFCEVNWHYSVWMSGYILLSLCLITLKRVRARLHVTDPAICFWEVSGAGFFCSFWDLWISLSIIISELISLMLVAIRYHQLCLGWLGCFVTLIASFMIAIAQVLILKSLKKCYERKVFPMSLAHETFLLKLVY